MATAPSAMSADRAARLALPRKGQGKSAPSATMRDRDQVEEATHLRSKETPQLMLDLTKSPPAAKPASQGCQRSQKATPTVSQKAAPSQAQGAAHASHAPAAAAMPVEYSEDDTDGQEVPKAKGRRTQAVLDSEDGASSGSDSQADGQDSGSDFEGGASSSDDEDSSLEGSEEEQDREPTPKKAKKAPAKPAGKAAPQRASAPASSTDMPAKARAGAAAKVRAAPAAPPADAPPVAAKPARRTPGAKDPLQPSVATNEQPKAVAGSTTVAKKPAALVRKTTCTPGTGGGGKRAAVAASTLQTPSSTANNTAKSTQGCSSAAAPASATPASLPAMSKAGRSTAELANDAVHTPGTAANSATGQSSAVPRNTPGPGSLSRVLASGPTYRVSGLTRRGALKPLHNIARK